MSEITRYPEEQLGKNDDDGTMVESRDALAAALVGHRIVRAGQESWTVDRWGRPVTETGFVITLDDGRKVRMREEADCCAYTNLEAFLLHPDKIDHIITGVGTTDGYERWHIYADMGDVLELQVGWSCGNPFYYGYGFSIQVVDDLPDVTAKAKEISS